MAIATCRRGRPTLLNFFLLIIIIFSVITIYASLRQAETHVRDSALPLVHSIQNEFGGLKDEVSARVAAQVSSQAETTVKAQNMDKTEPKVSVKGAHQLAGLNCDSHGGPRNDLAREMVYWEDIPEDSKFVSKFKRPGQYMTFESDHGGWNNLRMEMETCLAIAAATGRTLVLPPEEGMYLLHHEEGHKGKKQKNSFSYKNFFHMESIANEHVGLEVISMDEFLTREGITGNLRDKDGNVVFPPENKTDWNNQHGTAATLEGYLRTVGMLPPGWEPNKCIVAFPWAAENFDEIEKILKGIKEHPPSWESYIGHPTPVDAAPDERLRENWAWRDNICMYSKELQNAPLIHFSTAGESDRLLVHFYAFLFFENWKEDLWMKRFVRDHVRYIDEINCAAARVVNAVRERARTKDPLNQGGLFDAFHIRRGDFQYKETRIEADEILRRVEKHMVLGSTVYIGTDERNKTFFKPIADKYDVVYLDDFMHLLEGINTNYYGMLDQLITSRSRTFFGCWFSTFTGYINRLRGYHADNDKSPGYEDGIINSYYYAMEDRMDHMRTFYPVKREFFAREFPASWRGIDKGIGEL